MFEERKSLQMKSVVASRERVKLRPGPSKPTRLASISRPSSGTNDSDSISNLENDMKIINKKLCDLKNIAVEDNSLSGNTKGSSNYSVSSDGNRVRLQLYEDIMKKLTDVDREVLNRTGDTKISRARRNSRDAMLGSDLNCMPAHLTLVDRLMDFHVIIKRNEKLPTNHSNTNEIDTYKQLLKDKEQELANLETKLKQRDCELKKCAAHLESTEVEVRSLTVKYDSALRTWKRKLDSLEEENSTIKHKHDEEVDHKDKIISDIQEKMKNITGNKTEKESQKVAELDARVEAAKIQSNNASQQIESLQNKCNVLMYSLEKCIEYTGKDSLTEPCDDAPFEEVAAKSEVKNGYMHEI